MIKVNMTQLSAIKSRFYLGKETTKDVDELFKKLEKSVRSDEVVLKVFDLIYQFSFKHELRDFMDDWNQSNDVKLSDLEFLVANFLEEIDRLLDEKESTKAIEWF